jgi:NAD(P)-dependent dehydrogenase (short-subunit alcohol dehydrogenase family)
MTAPPRAVVVGSVAAKIGEPYISAYTASKHGVLGLVRSAAAEVATKGVTVNAVCPGYVDTPMTDATIAGIVAKTRTSEEFRATLAAAAQRPPVTVEVAEAVIPGAQRRDQRRDNVDGGGTTAWGHAGVAARSDSADPTHEAVRRIPESPLRPWKRSDAATPASHCSTPREGRVR